MKISVIIPCARSHFALLPNLLEELRQQTSLPDEVVVSLSSVQDLNGQEIDALEMGPWPFQLKVLRASSKQSPGLNRNIAASHTTGDVIINQDADDLPHPQRIEIIKYLFEHYAIDHLMHKWIPEGETLITYDKTKIPLSTFDHYDDIYRTPLGDRMHNGNNASSRAVIEAVHWIDVKHLQSDQDVQFNRDVYALFDRTAVIPSDLLIYRWRFSALQQNQSEKK